MYSHQTGFGQHVQNHSWFGASDLGYVLDACITAYDNEVVLSCSANNNGSVANCTFANYPGSFKDRIVMKVGANDNSGARANFSQCGFDLDFIAPGVISLYTGLSKTGNGLTDYITNGSCTPSPLDGTSFSAPHATGVAGLLVSYANNTAGIPNNLYPEDCEHIMENSATDLTAPPNTVGPDLETGAGRLNAGQALQRFKLPDYQVKHYSFNVPASTAILVGFHEQSCFRSAIAGLTGLNYVNRYEITGTNSHAVPGTYNLFDAWPLNAGSNMMGINSSLSPNCSGNALTRVTDYLPDATEIIKVGNITSTSATFKGYIYEILDASFTTVGWYPFKPVGNATFAYSLYLKSQFVGVEENSLTESSVSLYPNPSSDIVYVRSNEVKTIDVTVFNTLGQQVISQNKLSLTEDKTSINTTNLSNGIYFFNISCGNKNIVKKIVVNH